LNTSDREVACIYTAAKYTSV